MADQDKKAKTLIRLKINGRLSCKDLERPGWGNPQFSIDLVIHFENSHISGAKFLILMIRPLAPALPPRGAGRIR